MEPTWYSGVLRRKAVFVRKALGKRTPSYSSAALPPCGGNQSVRPDTEELQPLGQNPSLKQSISEPAIVRDPVPPKATLWRCIWSGKVGVRATPSMDGERTGATLVGGDVFEVSEEYRGEDGVLYLKLADGRGWLFESKAEVGTVCMRQQLAPKAEPELQKRLTKPMGPEFLERQHVHAGFESRLTVSKMQRSLNKEHWEREDEDFYGAQGAEGFRTFLVGRFGTISAGWRAMDKEGRGHLGFNEFCHACRRFGFHGNMRVLWKELDKKDHGAISLVELDPEAARYVDTFKQQLVTKYGDMATAWKEGLDPKGVGRVEEKDLTACCEKLGLDLDGKKLFKLLLSSPPRTTLGLSLSDFDESAAKRLATSAPAETTPAKATKSGSLRLGMHTTEGFKRALVLRHGSLLAGWRQAMDLDGNGRVGFGEFCQAMQRLSFHGDVRGLFQKLDEGGKGYLEFADLDKEAASAVAEFRAKMVEAHGNMLLAWVKAMDRKGAGCVTKQAFMRACEKVGYTGDAKRLFRTLRQEVGQQNLTLRDFDTKAFNALSRGDFRMLSEPEDPRKTDEGLLEMSFEDRQQSSLYFKMRRGWDAAQRKEFAKAVLEDVPEHLIDTAWAFEELCKRKFGSMISAWRHGLDADGNGKLTFNEFCRQVRLLGYVGSLKKLWADYGGNAQGFLTLKDLDPEADELVSSFLNLLSEHYRNVDAAWKKGFGKDPHDSVDEQELEKVCKALGFERSSKELFCCLRRSAAHRLLTIWDLDPTCQRSRQRGDITYASQPKSEETFAGHQGDGGELLPNERTGRKAFEELCKRKFGSVIGAWRHGLDPDGNGKLTFFEFCRQIRLLGYVGGPKKLWADYGGNAQGFLTLKDLDPGAEDLDPTCERSRPLLLDKDKAWAGEGTAPPEAAPSFTTEREAIGQMLEDFHSQDFLISSLETFKQGLVVRFGSLFAAWRNHFDADGNGTLGKAEFTKACQLLGIKAVQKLWNDLDTAGRGYVVLKDFDPEGGEAFASLEKLLVEKYGSVQEGWSKCFEQAEPPNMHVDQAKFARQCQTLGLDSSSGRLFRLLKPAPGRKYLIYEDLWRVLNKSAPAQDKTRGRLPAVSSERDARSCSPSPKAVAKNRQVASAKARPDTSASVRTTSSRQTATADPKNVTMKKAETIKPDAKKAAKPDTKTADAKKADAKKADAKKADAKKSDTKKADVKKPDAKKAASAKKAPAPKKTAGKTTDDEAEAERPTDASDLADAEAAKADGEEAEPAAGAADAGSPEAEEQEATSTSVVPAAIALLQQAAQPYQDDFEDQEHDPTEPPPPPPAAASTSESPVVLPSPADPYDEGFDSNPATPAAAATMGITGTPATQADPYDEGFDSNPATPAAAATMGITGTPATQARDDYDDFDDDSATADAGKEPAAGIAYDDDGFERSADEQPAKGPTAGVAYDDDGFEGSGDEQPAKGPSGATGHDDDGFEGSAGEQPAKESAGAAYDEDGFEGSAGEQPAKGSTGAAHDEDGFEASAGEQPAKGSTGAAYDEDGFEGSAGEQPAKGPTGAAYDEDGFEGSAGEEPVKESDNAPIAPAQPEQAGGDYDDFEGSSAAAESAVAATGPPAASSPEEVAKVAEALPASEQPVPDKEDGAAVAAVAAATALPEAAPERPASEAAGSHEGEEAGSAAAAKSPAGSAAPAAQAAGGHEGEEAGSAAAAKSPAGSAAPAAQADGDDGFEEAGSAAAEKSPVGSAGPVAQADHGDDGFEEAGGAAAAKSPAGSAGPAAQADRGDDGFEEAGSAAAAKSPAGSAGAAAQADGGDDTFEEAGSAAAAKSPAGSAEPAAQADDGGYEDDFAEEPAGGATAGSPGASAAGAPAQADDDDGYEDDFAEEPAGGAAAGSPSASAAGAPAQALEADDDGGYEDDFAEEPAGGATAASPAASAAGAPAQADDDGGYEDDFAEEPAGGATAASPAASAAGAPAQADDDDDGYEDDFAEEHDDGGAAAGSPAASAAGAPAQAEDSYGEDDFAEESADLARAASRGSATAQRSEAEESYGDDEFAEESADLARAASRGSAAAQRSEAEESYGDDDFAEESAEMARVASRGSAVGQRSEAEESYGDDDFAEESAEMARVASRGSAVAQRSEAGDSYGDDEDFAEESAQASRPGSRGSALGTRALSTSQTPRSGASTPQEAGRSYEDDEDDGSASDAASSSGKEPSFTAPSTPAASDAGAAAQENESYDADDFETPPATTRPARPTLVSHREAESDDEEEEYSSAEGSSRPTTGAGTPMAAAAAPSAPVAAASRPVASVAEARAAESEGEEEEEEEAYTPASSDHGAETAPAAEPVRPGSARVSSAPVSLPSGQVDFEEDEFTPASSREAEAPARANDPEKDEDGYDDEDFGSAPASSRGPEPGQRVSPAADAQGEGKEEEEEAYTPTSNHPGDEAAYDEDDFDSARSGGSGAGSAPGSGGKAAAGAKLGIPATASTAPASTPLPSLQGTLQQGAAAKGPSPAPSSAAESGEGSQAGYEDDFDASQGSAATPGPPSTPPPVAPTVQPRKEAASTAPPLEMPPTFARLMAERDAQERAEKEAAAKKKKKDSPEKDNEAGLWEDDFDSSGRGSHSGSRAGGAGVATSAASPVKTRVGIGAPPTLAGLMAARAAGEEPTGMAKSEEAQQPDGAEREEGSEAFAYEDDFDDFE